MRGVYAIVDLEAVDHVGIDPIGFGEAILQRGVCALQLRAKNCDGARFLAIARGLDRAAREARTPFYVNDRVDIALLAGVGGVHVGQTDLAPREVRSLAERCSAHVAVGLSTHNEEQLDRALDEPIDYIAIGPVFSTISKARPDPVLGLERAKSLAARVKARRPTLPVVAIGGIGVARAAELSGVVDCVAVISALVPKASEGAGGVCARTQALLEAFAGPRP
ncbi:MAG: thiamine phosphate synthase [Polyangiaceae bacterium]|nr:thiamine phosphate synthase [Polyangiaceae bacterium]